jgi:hypothetical protein
MLERFLPARADNAYFGYPIALWLFALVVAFKALIALNGSIFNAYSVLTSVDGIPLNAWPPVATQDYLSLSAAFGLSNATLYLVCAIAIVRYRSLVPLMFALLLIESLLRRLVDHFIPSIGAGTASGGTINIVLTAVIVVGLALSIAPRRRAASR